MKLFFSGSWHKAQSCYTISSRLQIIHCSHAPSSSTARYSILVLLGEAGIFVNIIINEFYVHIDDRNVTDEERKTALLYFDTDQVGNYNGNGHYTPPSLPSSLPLSPQGIWTWQEYT